MGAAGHARLARSRPNASRDGAGARALLVRRSRDQRAAPSTPRRPGLPSAGRPRPATRTPWHRSRRRSRRRRTAQPRRPPQSCSGAFFERRSARRVASQKAPDGPLPGSSAAQSDASVSRKVRLVAASVHASSCPRRRGECSDSDGRIVGPAGSNRSRPNVGQDPGAIKARPAAFVHIRGLGLPPGPSSPAAFHPHRVMRERRDPSWMGAWRPPTDVLRAWRI
jgi:hypothetical protein